MSRQRRLGLAGAQRSRGNRAEQDTGSPAATGCQLQARCHTHHGDVHECARGMFDVNRVPLRRRNVDGLQQLARVKGRFARAAEKILQRDFAFPVRADDVRACAARNQGRRKVCRGGGVAQVTAHSRETANLFGGHKAGGVRHAGVAFEHERRACQLAQSDQRAQAQIASVCGANALQRLQFFDIDNRLGLGFSGLHIKHQVGAAGDDARCAVMLRQQRQRFRQCLGGMVVERLHGLGQVFFPA